MSIREGVKDFVVGLIVITLCAILTILLILLWPFIAVVGWFVIMLLFVAIGILIAFAAVTIVGRFVRGSYKKR